MQLAVLERHLGSLEKVRGVLTVNGYVNSVAGFPDSPKVINGASDLLMAVFGEAGRHVRAAVGGEWAAPQCACGVADDGGDLDGDPMC